MSDPSLERGMPNAAQSPNSSSGPSTPQTATDPSSTPCADPLAQQAASRASAESSPVAPAQAAAQIQIQAKSGLEPPGQRQSLPPTRPQRKRRKVSSSEARAHLEEPRSPPPAGVDELRAEFLRAVFEDPLFLPQKVLGYEKLTDRNLEWLAWALRTHRGLFLGPPQHFKSTTLSVTLPVLLLLLDPNQCGFIGSKTLGKAESFLRAIRLGIKQSPPLADILHDQSAQDSDEGFTVRRAAVRHDPSIRPVAPGASLVQSHAEWAILDDLVDEDDFKSPGVRESTVQWFLRSFLRAMTKGAKIIIVGQRWHEDDLYGYIEKHSRSLGFDVMVAPALRDGRALDPAILDVKDLEAIRAALTTPLFELQWNQNASAVAGDFFRWDQFKKYEHPPPVDELDIYQGIDLAISQSQAAHYTVIATVGSHRKTGDDFLLHVSRGKWGFATQLAKAEAEAEAWKPINRRCENQAYQQAFVETTTKSRWPIRGSTAKMDKVAHARRWQAKVEAGKFWVPNPEEVPWSREFLKECCAFPPRPRMGFDDQVDAVSYAEDEIAAAARTGGQAATVNPASALDSIFGERPEWGGLG